MKRSLKTALAACGATLALTLSGVASASAATSAPTAGTDVQNLAACSKVKADESVKIRTSASTGATALGVFPKGSTSGCLIKSGITGGSYKLCGQSAHTWAKISYRGIKGYVPDTCVESVGGWPS